METMKIFILIIHVVLLTNLCHGYHWRLQRRKRMVDSSFYLNTAPQTRSFVCQDHPSLPGHAGCPSQKCYGENDCSWMITSSTCICDKELCGSVCVSRNFECNRLALPRNGMLTYSTEGRRFVTSTAKYSCNLGYVLQGNKIRTCQANGQYSGDEATCVPADTERCSPPPVVPHTRRFPMDGLTDDLFEYRAGAKYTYACAEGFTSDKPNLNITAICLKGKWNMKNIYCSIKSCGHPGTLANGRLVNNNYTYGHKVAYFCSEGYTLSCEQPSIKPIHCQVRTCQSNGRWSGSNPICQPLLCPVLKSPEHGMITESLNTVRSVVRYSCHSGYRLVGGAESRMCKEDGNWDGSEPRCVIQDCGLPAEIPNAHKPKYTSTRYGSVASYHCKPKTTFIGENSGKVLCGSNGKWSPDPPKCRLHCKAPSVATGKALIGKANGEEAIGMVPSDTTLWIKCNSAYQLQKILYPRCDNGTWTRIPKCVPRDCPQRPPIVKNGIARFYGTKHLNKVKYQCYVGYEIVSGSNTLICQFGKWHGEKPRCKKKKCPWVYPSANLRVWLLGADGVTKNPWTRPETLPDHEEIINFECLDKNMKLFGQTHAICISGSWSPSGLPECRLRKHKSIPWDWFFYRDG